MMTKEHLEKLWKRLASASDVHNLEYGEAVTIGSVFAEMKREILNLQNKVKAYEQFEGEVEYAMDKLGWNNYRIEHAYDELQEKINMKG